MGRFDYLKDAAASSKAKPGKGGKQKRKKGATAPAPDGRHGGVLTGATAERVEAIYVRKETVRAVWRHVKADGGESVSELVEDLLLRWLRERA